MNLMKENGFTQILIFIVAIIVAGTAGAVYYTGVIPGRVTSQVTPTPSLTPTNHTFLKVQILPTKQPLAIELLKNRSPSRLSSTPIPTLIPTILPTKITTPTPICNANNNPNINTTVTSNIDGAALALSPNFGSYKKGETFSVKLNLDSKDQDILAADVLLQFNPDQLSIVSIIGAVGSYNQFTFPQDTFNNSTGRTYLSLTGNETSTILKGNLTLATINFKISNSASGNIEVKFDFDPQNPTKTTDSNLAVLSNNGEALETVINGIYTIKPENCN